MAFRRNRAGAGRSKSRTRGVRRRNPYELVQISICRAGLATGLSDCSVPDQFFHCLVNTRDWVRPMISGTGLPVDVNLLAAHQARDIVVRGIQFDYQYSYVPGLVSVEDIAVGISSIRSGIVKMRMQVPGSGGEFDQPLPQSPDSNLFFHQDTMLVQPEAAGPRLRNFESARKYRILWRGMDMMENSLIPFGGGSAVDFDRTVESTTPGRVTLSRHVRLRTGARLAADEGLFFVTEIVNPFLTDNPTIALDLFGSLVVKSTVAGNRYDT